ncbi:hypothetical protein IFM89_014243 [Coptis chinensis]|uniref:Transcription initiation factor TFIID subunit 1 n=1 Tax=Coptis chinensis TaxID=261450 RepID=A0A835M8V4_9MAGN|nr:hypothetical protein IFM89_014243 [Coptis chinensis]
MADASSSHNQIDGKFIFLLFISLVIVKKYCFFNYVWLDDDEDEEEEGGGNRLLGFMFGNVDNAGDLDVDYLGEDAKEHLAALADKLGSSLTDINLSIKSAHTRMRMLLNKCSFHLPTHYLTITLFVFLQVDYDEKAEDAVDYEDIDEQYEGPEIFTTTEEDHILPKTEYFSAEVSLSVLGQRNSVFDEENYDEDVEFDEEQKVVNDCSEAQPIITSAVLVESLDPDCGSRLPCDASLGKNNLSSPEKDENAELFVEEEKSFEDTVHSPGSFEDDKLAVGLEDFQEDESEVFQEPLNEKSMSSLPVLYREDETVVLRFSEIFGIHEPKKKGEKRIHRYPIPIERYKVIDAYDTVEEDEEVFFRGSCQSSFNTEELGSLSDDSMVKILDEESQISDVREGVSEKTVQTVERRKDSCLLAEPMKESVTEKLAAGWGSPSCPKFCPLDQQDWEDGIVWGDSPFSSRGSSESCVISEVESEDINKETVSEVGQQCSGLELQMEADEKYHHLFLSSYPIELESFGSRNFSDHVNLPFTERKHPQQLRLDSFLKVDGSTYAEGGKENETKHLDGNGAIKNFTKLSLQNKDMLEDSWLDKIIWDPNEAVLKPKLILDLQDEQMLFEISETRDVKHLQAHAGAMIVTRSVKPNGGDYFDLPGHLGTSVGRFNISNDNGQIPFLGDIRPGFSQSCLETNMYRAPIFPHKLCSTDYLLVRSAKGKLSLRRIDRIDVVGQQEPHMEVISPGTKNLQTYIWNRLSVYIYREFVANEKRGLRPFIRADDLSAQFPNISEPFIRKRLKHCADLQRGQNGHLLWVMRRNFRIPLEEEIRRMVTPENVCAYESMQAGLYRLKRLGISRLTQPTGLSSAMNQLPDEAIALAAASHIERELQITPWNLSSNFVSCTNQDRENIERLEITGVGDPSGRGLGFSYVRVAPKAPVSSAVVKKKTAIAKGGSTVTGTDADLRRLSMDAAREVLLKFNVPEEQIAKLTRWHRIAMIRKLSSEQATSGVKVDSTTISKYARGQRMSFLQLQQQTREKCQEIWDRQVQCLSAADEDENDSESEANSDLDSFAGDLENLLDAEECGVDEEGSFEFEHNKEDGIKGLKMRRRPSQPQAEEEIEDEAAEAAELCRMLMDEDESERRKKKKTASGVQEVGSSSVEQTKKINTIVKKIFRTPQPDGSFILKEQIITDPKEACISIHSFFCIVEKILAKRALSEKVKSKKGNEKSKVAPIGLLKKKYTAMGDGLKLALSWLSYSSHYNQVIKEKKQTDKPVRENFECGACGQKGHMRTNKNCPRYGEDLDDSTEPGKSNFLDPPNLHQKTSVKKLIPKSATRLALVETSENSEKAGSKTKVKVKCGPAEKISEKIAPEESQNSDKQVTVDSETGTRSVNRISRIVFSNKLKPEDTQVEPPKLVIKPPAEVDRDQPHKKLIIKQPKGNISVDQVQEESSSGLQENYRKTKTMRELSSSEKLRKQEGKRLSEEAEAKRKANEERRLWEEEDKRRIAELRRQAERQAERLYEEQRMQAEQQRLAELRRQEAMWKDEEDRQKARKKKKTKGPEMVDEYFEAKPSRTDRRLPGRERATKRRSVVELGNYGAEYAPQSKRRRGEAGEVGLANILEGIVDSLKDATEVSYLFLKPVSKKEAPDYHDIIEHPMDLSTIKEKVRKMKYKDREVFRHDVWQITFNAHRYNDGRNPGIPPLADQLLELCDYLLDQNDERLAEAEAGIEIRPT